MANRAGQGVGTVITNVAGRVTFAAGGGATLLTAGATSEVSAPAAAVGVEMTIGSVVNAVRIATTPMQRSSQSGSSSDSPSPKPGSAGGPGAGKKFPESARNAEREASNNTCRFCGSETVRSSRPAPNRSNIDHAIPKSRGGNNSPANAQNTCQTCNLKKGTRTTREYLHIPQ